jgi:glycosyltransferase involved in cell wall biosynthesis
MTQSAAPAATVVITTKNRLADLRNAVASALAQDVPVEVLVVDDGSTDGTADAIRSEFPGVRVQREEVSRGYIVRRNEAAKLASAPIVVSIDDDATFPSTQTVRQTLAQFDHPRIGAVAIPFIDVNKNSGIRNRAQTDSGVWISASYTGTAHALRRDVFLSLGGYRESLFHQGEESDYCARMFGAGYVVRLGTADPIHHFESPRRDFRRMDLFGRRNDVLFAWHNVPMPAMLAHVVGTTVNGTLFGFKVKRPLRMMHGLAKGWMSIPAEWSNRKPLSRATYTLLRHIRKSPRPLQLQDVESQLPPMRDA